MTEQVDGVKMSAASKGAEGDDAPVAEQVDGVKMSAASKGAATMATLKACEAFINENEDTRKDAVPSFITRERFGRVRKEVCVLESE